VISFLSFIISEVVLLINELQVVTKTFLISIFPGQFVGLEVDIYTELYFSWVGLV
jgi:hypothetical protein